MRSRIVYAVLAIAVMCAGLASRRYRDDLPTFIAQYSGDTLWSLMLYLVVSAAFPRQSITRRTQISIALAMLVEISQLYHTPWIDSIRSTRLGGLVLGFGFLWSDLLCYAIGIATGAAIEVATRRAKSRSQHIGDS